MSSSKPIIRQVAWLSTIPQFAVIGLLLAIYYFTTKSFYPAFLLAMITYLVFSFALRYGIPRHHRKGIFLFKAGKYELAISEFQNSYNFFTKHAWIDRFRYITLLSSSRISYTEMALLNIAFCNAQVGNGEIAKQYYERTLQFFPDSEMAKTSLNMIKSFQPKSDTPVE